MTDDGTPTPVLVLGYGGPDPVAATPSRRRLAACGVAVSLVAVGFNLFLLAAVAGLLVDRGRGLTAKVLGVVIGASAVVDLALAVGLVVIAVQLLRRHPAAVGRLRRWSTLCLLGVGGFVVACSAFALVLRPRDPMREPALPLGLIGGVAGCVYPVVALGVTRRRAMA